MVGPETFVTKTGANATLIPIDEKEERFDIEYVNPSTGTVIRHRQNLPRATVDDLRRLEGWRKP